MLDLIVNLATLAIVAVLILWGAWWAWGKWFALSTTSGAGKVVGQIADTTQDFSARAALRMIRWLDEVEEDPKVLAAWNVVYAAIGGKASEVSVAPPAVTATPTPLAPAADPHATEIEWRPGQ